MKELPLTQGKFALVDDEDFNHLNQWKWFAQKQSGGKFRVIRNQKKTEVSKKRTTIKLHRFILNIKEDSIKIDHINGNPLDNRKINLRACTHQENCRNRDKQSNNTSGVKGVIWYKPTQQWRAQTHINRKHISLGCYDNIQDAARAYNNFILENFGDYAKINNIGNK